MKRILSFSVVSLIILLSVSTAFGNPPALKDIKFDKESYEIGESGKVHIRIAGSNCYIEMLYFYSAHNKELFDFFVGWDSDNPGSTKGEYDEIICDTWNEYTWISTDFEVVGEHKEGYIEYDISAFWGNYNPNVDDRVPSNIFEIDYYKLYSGKIKVYSPYKPAPTTTAPPTTTPAPTTTAPPQTDTKTEISSPSEGLSIRSEYIFGAVALIIILAFIFSFAGKKEKVVEREKVVLREVEEVLPTKCPSCGGKFKGKSGDECEFCGEIIKAEKIVRKVE